MFAVGLSNNQVFPTLFGGDSSTKYWAASKRAYYPYNKRFDEARETEENYIRCVYDIWYWGEEHQANGFTWGDK